MAKSLYWMQAGSCGGDTMSFLSTESPDAFELLRLLEIEVLWHPSFSIEKHGEHQGVIDSILSGERPLDILCVEGSILRGPDGSGMCDALGGKPKQDLVKALAAEAQCVVAIGTCATYGGLVDDPYAEATGLQFRKAETGGLLGVEFVAGNGLPVINLPGCPCHSDTIAGALMSLALGEPLTLGPYNAPSEWYGTLVHQGCTRNEYHEFRVEEREFGERGCLFFHMGCQGPLTYGPCNKLLWNGRSSKTRAGVPCFGCTRPDFPKAQALFETRNIEGIPLDLPDGVDRAHYLAYKGMAAAAAPSRLKERKVEI